MHTININLNNKKTKDKHAYINKYVNIYVYNYYHFQVISWILFISLICWSL